MRGISEFYGALILFALSLALIPYALSIAKGLKSSLASASVRPLLVTRINATHALCYVQAPWEPSRTRSIIEFRFWLYSTDIDGDGFLDPSPGIFNSTVPPGTYVLVTPPIVCVK